MNRSLIIHIGAQKCGSSSVQEFLALHAAMTQEDAFRFKILCPELAERLNKGSLGSENELDAYHSEWPTSCLVLSHECLCFMPRAVQMIVDRALSQWGADKVTIIGYTRVQSSYLMAEYKQWYFRDLQLLLSDYAVVESAGLRPERFLPVERRLIASIIRTQDSIIQYRCNWHHYYLTLNQLLEPYMPLIEIKSNHIPSSAQPYSLKADFFAKAKIRASESLISQDVRSNPAFHPVLCEAIATAICTQKHGYEWLPNPHSHNNELAAVSSWLYQLPTPNLSDLNCHDYILSKLRDSIDILFAQSNIKYCSLVGADLSYFVKDHAQEDRSTQVMPEILAALSDIQDERRPDRTDELDKELLSMLHGCKSFLAVL